MRRYDNSKVLRGRRIFKRWATVTVLLTGVLILWKEGKEMFSGVKKWFRRKDETIQ